MGVAGETRLEFSTQVRRVSYRGTGLVPVSLRPIGLEKIGAGVLGRQAPETGLLRCRIWRPKLRTGTGAVAQLGERLICIQEVAGSIPTSSTSYHGPVAQVARAHP
jgi:hypothetical protein